MVAWLHLRSHPGQKVSTSAEATSDGLCSGQSGRGLPHSKTLARWLKRTGRSDGPHLPAFARVCPHFPRERFTTETQRHGETEGSEIRVLRLSPYDAL